MMKKKFVYCRSCHWPNYPPRHLTDFKNMDVPCKKCKRPIHYHWTNDGWLLENRDSRFKNPNDILPIFLLRLKNRIKLAKENLFKKRSFWFGMIYFMFFLSVFVPVIYYLIFIETQYFESVMLCAFGVFGLAIALSVFFMFKYDKAKIEMYRKMEENI